MGDFATDFEFFVECFFVFGVINSSLVSEAADTLISSTFSLIFGSSTESRLDSFSKLTYFFFILFSDVEDLDLVLIKALVFEFKRD